MIEILTPRLRLRGFVPQDLEPLARLYANPQVMAYIGAGSVRTKAETKLALDALLQKAQTPGPQMLAVELLSSGQMIGRAGLVPWQFGPLQEWEIGYMLAPEHWGQGLATEAVAALLPPAFAQIPQDYLISLIHPQNQASQKVALNNGARYWKRRLIEGIPARVYRYLRAGM